MALRHEAAETELIVAKKKREPWRKFYPEAWMGDPLLRACSLQARGVWADLCCLMWTSPAEGYLVDASGEPLDIETVGRMISERPARVAKAVDELIKVGVASKCGDTGAVYSRRIVRDADARERAKRNGSKGGNPSLLDNQLDNQEDNHVGLPSSSIYPLGSNSSGSGGSAEGGPSFLAFWQVYPKHRRSRQDKCRAAWVAAVRDGDADPAVIVGKATEYAASPVGKGQFCLTAFRWLEDRCWEDAPEAWQDKKETASAGRYIPQ